MAEISVQPVKLSFYERIKLRIEAFCKSEPQWASVAISALTVITPLVGTILAIVEPADVPIMVGVVTAIEADLAGLTEVIKESGGDAPSVSAFTAAISNNIGRIEAMVDVKNPDTKAKITAITTTVATEIQAIQANFQPAAV